MVTVYVLSDDPKVMNAAKKVVARNRNKRQLAPPGFRRTPAMDDYAVYLKSSKGKAKGLQAAAASFSDIESNILALCPPPPGGVTC